MAGPGLGLWAFGVLEESWDSLTRVINMVLIAIDTENPK